MNADFEVKKLKDLVKKLELQNQHLRYKTGKLGPGSHSRPSQQDLVPVCTYEGTEGHSEDVLSDSKFEDVSKSNNCSWLFSIDKQTPDENPNMLIHWLRYELDHPATQKLEFARREIISTLNTEQKISVATESEGFGKYEKRAISKVDTTENDIVDEDTSNAEYYPSDSPTHMPREEDRLSSHGLVHHMPLPSHTMTSKYGLIDVSSMEAAESQHKMRPRRSASPSSAEWSRGLSPSRNSHQATYSRSHRSPVRRGLSPSRMSDVSSNSDHINFTDRSRTTQPERSMPRRYRSPSPAAKTPTPSKAMFLQRDSPRLSNTESSNTRRNRSPSPAARAPTPSKTMFMQRDTPRVDNADYSHTRRYRSPSPGGRAVTPSKSVYSHRDSPRLENVESSNKRYRSPSPAGRSSTSTSSKSAFSQRDSPRVRNNEASLTPRASGLRQPLTSLRSRTPRSTAARSSGIPLTQSDIRRAASTEELSRNLSGEPKSSQLPRSGGYSLRKALPRPSHSMGTSSPKYVNPRRPGISQDYSSRSSPDYTQTSPRSDTGVTTNASGVWNDGEFF